VTVIRRLLRCTLNTGLISNLVIELGLQADEKVAGEAEAELGTEGEVGADCLFLTRSTYELKRDYRAEGLCFFSLGFAEEVMVLEAHPVFQYSGSFPK
jgi:hypothetical protein